MKARIVLVTAAVVTLGFAPRPAEATHNCTKEEPRCVDRRTLVEKPGRQEIVSRVLGHHCYDSFTADLPDRDNRVLYSRIGVVFSNVTHRSGYLETITVSFEGKERQIMGNIDAIGKKNNFHAYDGVEHDPGTSITLDVGKQVDFYYDNNTHDIGQYRIEHQSMASPPSGRGQGGKDPGGDPRPGGRPSVSVDCEGKHWLTMQIVPPSPPRCQRRGEPCPS